MGKLTRPDQKVDSKRLEVLVVEDEALIAKLLKDVLNVCGCNISGVACTMSEALSLVAERQPDLAFCDIRLADGDSGTDVATALAVRGIPCFFVSVDRPAPANHHLILGWIRKPFHIAAIGEAAAIARGSASGRQRASVPSGLLF